MSADSVEPRREYSSDREPPPFLCVAPFLQRRGRQKTTTTTTGSCCFSLSSPVFFTIISPCRVHWTEEKKSASSSSSSCACRDTPLSIAISLPSARYSPIALQLLFGVPRRFPFHPPAAPPPIFHKWVDITTGRVVALTTPSFPPGAVFHSLCGWVGERMKEEEEEEEKPLLRRCVLLAIFFLSQGETKEPKCRALDGPHSQCSRRPVRTFIFSVASHHHHPTLKFKKKNTSGNYLKEIIF